jgi:hypothetical protein
MRNAISKEVDTRGDFGIAHRVEPHAIELLNRVERIALRLLIDAGRIRQIQHRIAGAAKLDALIHGRQEARAPTRIPAARSLFAGAENHEGRQSRATHCPNRM